MTDLMRLQKVKIIKIDNRQSWRYMSFRHYRECWRFYGFLSCNLGLGKNRPIHGFIHIYFLKRLAWFTAGAKRENPQNKKSRVLPVHRFWTLEYTGKSRKRRILLFQFLLKRSSSQLWIATILKIAKSGKVYRR